MIVSSVLAAVLATAGTAYGPLPDRPGPNDPAPMEAWKLPRYPGMPSIPHLPRVPRIPKVPRVS